MTNLKQTIDKIIRFRDERDWAQYHTIGELSRAISIEAAELNELVLFGRVPELEDLKDELADILIYTLLLCHDLNLDPLEIIESKLNQNIEKYPIAKCKGKSTKYNRL